MSIRNLVAISLVIALAIAAAVRLLDPERLSALGSILSGAGSLLAVVWFSAGLRYQSHQLDEQRKQFVAQFQYLKESGRRDSLALVQGILERAEERAVAGMPGIKSLTEIPGKYMDMVELKPILESENPDEVLNACANWNKKEVSAMTLLQGIKSAAEVYLRGTGATDIDYSKPADLFYFIYSPRFSNEPFFNSVSGAAHILSEIMVRFQPARDAAMIAFLAATAKTFDPAVIKMEKLREDIAKHREAGYPLPAIAADV